MGVIDELAIGFASSGLWAMGGAAAFGLVIRPTYQYLSRRRPLRRLIPYSSRPVLVVSSAVPNTDSSEYFHYLVTPDAVTGFNELHHRLVAAGYPQDKILSKFPGEVGPDDLARNDLILIGGYENNRISADLNDTSGHVYLKENKIFIDGVTNPYDIELNAQGKIIRDYCLISRRQSPYCNGDGCWVLSFGGIRHYGTEAGIKFLSEKNLRKSAFRSVGHAKEVYLVVSCGVTHLGPSYFSLKNIREEYLWCDGREIRLR